MKILYHFTSAQNALNIVRSGKFHLSHASGSGVEEQFNQGKLFFLSTTRSRSNIFATRTAGGSEVMFVLDADKLRSRFKMFPINFWGSKREHSEAEERLVSDKETIDLDAVISIHANTGLNDEARIKSTGMYLRRLAIEAHKQKKFPLYFYGSKKDMLSMQPIKRIGLYNDITGSSDGKVVPEPDTRPDFIKQIEKEQKDRDAQDMYPFLVLLHAAIRKDFRSLKTFSDVSDVRTYYDLLSNINGFRVRQTVLSEMSRRLMNARHHGGVGSNQLKIANAFILLVKRTGLTFNEVPEFIAKRIAETVNV